MYSGTCSRGIEFSFISALLTDVTVNISKTDKGISKRRCRVYYTVKELDKILHRTPTFKSCSKSKVMAFGNSRGIFTANDKITSQRPVKVLFAIRIW